MCNLASVVVEVVSLSYTFAMAESAFLREAATLPPTGRMQSNRHFYRRCSHKLKHIIISSIPVLLILDCIGLFLLHLGRKKLVSNKHNSA